MYRRGLVRGIVAACAMAMAMAPAASASFDAFLKIDGIKGESTDARFKDAIDIDSFSWGVSNTARSGKPTIKAFTVTKKSDSATPPLVLAASSGKQIPCAALTLRKSGGEQFEFLKYTMRDVLITNFETSGASSADRPDEVVGLSFGKLEIQYTQQGADGRALPPVFVGWDYVNHVQYGSATEC